MGADYYKSNLDARGMKADYYIYIKVNVRELQLGVNTLRLCELLRPAKKLESYNAQENLKIK